MTSVLFFAMVIALVAGVACFGFASFCGLRESRSRGVFFVGCLIGFWGGCVGLLADEIADFFSTVQIGMEESVHNAFVEHWQKLGYQTTAEIRRGAPLCTAQDLKSSSVPDCALAVGVNSTAVCRQWVLYVPFLLPYVRPCPALRTTREVLADAGARQVLTAAINDPCDYLSKSLDTTTKRFRKALGCEAVQPMDNVVLIVDQPGSARTWVLHRGDVHLP
ncbi:hypothetical protein [Telmatospirillum sp.]|uniref:hypothetical protein n=1 Tax=Telmatospirillum sp. TaxID=2079197 RepID=UPI002848AEB3|nr:hypothetical protein [Telmatospirillum sp.]MDR3439021.1 hypothetical protein [Telmatospirillum sp.]